ncbi:hypothetical protein HZA55_01485 [Candidatus Poribacteria bacterium]|nr:hypothetical protein [Candidatus Poribacteria bacterium]
MEKITRRYFYKIILNIIGFFTIGSAFIKLNKKSISSDTIVEKYKEAMYYKVI